MHDLDGASPAALARTTPDPIRPEAAAREPLVVDIAQARARYFGKALCRATIFKLIRAGELESLTVGARRLLTVRGIRAFIERRTAAQRES
jgi:hypothetical protein